MPPLGQLVAATLGPDRHVEVELADNMPDASQAWSHWQRKHAPENAVEYEAVERDAGQHLAYIRMVGRRREGIKLEPYCRPDGSFWLPHAYEPKDIAKSHDTQPE